MTKRKLRNDVRILVSDVISADSGVELHYIDYI